MWLIPFQLGDFVLTYTASIDAKYSALCRTTTILAEIAALLLIFSFYD